MAGRRDRQGQVGTRGLSIRLTRLYDEEAPGKVEGRSRGIEVGESYEVVRTGDEVFTNSSQVDRSQRIAMLRLIAGFKALPSSTVISLGRFLNTFHASPPECCLRRHG